MSTFDIAMEYKTYGFKLSFTSHDSTINSFLLDFSDIGTSAQEFIDYFDIVSVGDGYLVNELGNYLVELKVNTPFIVWEGTTSSVHGVFDTASAGSSFFGLDFSLMDGLVGQTGIAGAYGSGGDMLGDTITFSYKGLGENPVPLSESQVYMLTGLGILAAVGLSSKAKKTYRRFLDRGMTPREAAGRTVLAALAIPRAVGREMAGIVGMGCAMAYADIKAALAMARGLFRKPGRRASAACAPAI